MGLLRNAGTVGQSHYSGLSVAVRFESELLNAQLVDVRTAAEYAEGHIADAIHIDVKQKNFLQTADSLLDKTRPVAVYCKGGVRSRQAAQLLLDHGFIVYNLQDGYDGWLRFIKGNE